MTFLLGTNTCIGNLNERQARLSVSGDRHIHSLLASRSRTGRLAGEG